MLHWRAFISSVLCQRSTILKCLAPILFEDLHLFIYYIVTFYTQERDKILPFRLNFPTYIHVGIILLYTMIYFPLFKYTFKYYRYLFLVF